MAWSSSPSGHRLPSSLLSPSYRRFLPCLCRRCKIYTLLFLTISFEWSSDTHPLSYQQGWEDTIVKQNQSNRNQSDMRRRRRKILLFFKAFGHIYLEWKHVMTFPFFFNLW
ncbi:uncharacterized protein LOC110279303 [Arachis duranensis]|uniref:Uncharacterized protein LOC110279303 n=1 Tax=Arachis duranensis TaxID=130453 RepID=A0A9C6TDJ9_ARADU|nr:uncharacterized protein LOC110279303 [Arachis duranensis]